MQAASLSATSGVDSAVLRDFGDGPAFTSQSKGKEKEEEHIESLSTMFGGIQSDDRQSRRGSEGEGLGLGEVDIVA